MKSVDVPLSITSFLYQPLTYWVKFNQELEKQKQKEKKEWSCGTFCALHKRRSTECGEILSNNNIRSLNLQQTKHNWTERLSDYTCLPTALTAICFDYYMVRCIGFESDILRYIVKTKECSDCRYFSLFIINKQDRIERLGNQAWLEPLVLSEPAPDVHSTQYDNQNIKQVFSSMKMMNNRPFSLTCFKKKTMLYRICEDFLRFLEFLESILA